LDYRDDPILAAALAYWRGKRRGRSMPSRRDIDPIEVPALLPHLQLVDIVGGRFRYRLVGTELVTVFGRDYTGMFPDELFPGTRGQMICEVFAAVRKARKPMFLRNRYLTAKHWDLEASRLLMPLSDNDREVNMILGALTFGQDAASRIAGAWGSADLAIAGTTLAPVEEG
jgi:hypothetical protein